MHFNIPIFVPHAGCPHDCVFCNQKNITGQDKVLDLDNALQTIEEHLSSIQNKHSDYSVEIAFFGGSFTGIPVKEQEAYLSLANTYIKSGSVDGIRLSTRPDYIDDDILRRLKSYGVTTIELGVQSLDEEVLQASNRGHNLEDVYIACDLIKKYDFKLGLQMMLGLPKDTLDRTLDTARTIVSLRPDMTRIYPTIVIEDTDLETLYRSNSYKALDLDEAVTWAAEVYKIFYREHIPVIRMGLQASEALADAIAGPYHPSFRQMVESRIYLETLMKYLKSGQVTEIYVHPKNISYLVGQKRHNLNLLESYFKLKRIKVYPKEIPIDEIEIIISGQVFKVPKITTI